VSYEPQPGTIAFRAQAKNAPPTSKAWGSLPRLALRRTRSHPVRVWGIA